MSRPYRIRLAQPGDEEGISCLLMCLAMEENAGVLPLEDTQAGLETWVRTELRAYSGGHITSFYLVAEDDEGICGCIHGRLFFTEPPFRGLMGAATKLFVLPECRGKGIAPALIRGLVEIFRSLGCTHLQLDVAAERDRLDRIYRRMGFRPVQTTYRCPVPDFCMGGPR